VFSAISLAETTIPVPLRTAGDPTQADWDNHANQLNPNNDEYANSRDSGDDAPCDAEFEWMSDNGD